MYFLIDRPHRVAAEPSFCLAEPLAGLDVVAPPMHWAGEHGAVQIPISQGPTAMQAGVVDGEELAFRVADGEPAAGGEHEPDDTGRIVLHSSGHDLDDRWRSPVGARRWNAG
jgi:hypothetical protein